MWSNQFYIDVITYACFNLDAANLEQERRLKRLKTLRDLEIGIQHQIVNALELSSPAHHPPPQKRKKNNEKLFILVISLVEKNGRTVKQSSDLKTSSLPLQYLEAQLSESLPPVVVLLILFVCHVHSGSHQYS